MNGAVWGCIDSIRHKGCGVYENRTRKTTIDRNEVKRLKAEGLSTYKIADAMKISRMSVHRILNQSA